MDSLFPLVTALLSNGIAQILKPFFNYIRYKRFDIHQALSSGGFPSSHTSTVVALSISIGFLEGFNSTIFSACAIFAFIVIYDAFNVRYYAGKNIQLTQQLISDLDDEGITFDNPIYKERFKTVLGHKFVEVVGGFIVGIITSLVCYYIYFTIFK